MENDGLKEDYDPVTRLCWVWNLGWGKNEVCEGRDVWCPIHSAYAEIFCGKAKDYPII